MTVALPDARQLSDEVLEALRLRALRGRELGLDEATLACLLGVSRETVSRWWCAYQRGGLDALPHERTGHPVGVGRTLTVEQEIQIQTVLREMSPPEWNIASPLWTRRAVAELIQKEYGIAMPVRTVGEYLKRWGFTPKRPQRHARQQDPEEVRAWMETIYPAIQARARWEGADLLWCDETGIDINTHIGTGYAPQGEPAILEVSSAPCRINVVSAISASGELHFMTYPGTMTGTLFIVFLTRLLASASRKVFLIVDQLTVHQSHEVLAWVEAHGTQLELFWMPRRAPERMPVEYLNNDLKTQAHAEKLPENRQELRSQVQRVLQRLAKLPEHVASYFCNPFVEYASTPV